ncbi:MAG: hypothetical protein JWO98_99 [Frankiales bacterium]|nr:hypothetical protein [Frankiales bacterium]
MTNTTAAWTWGQSVATTGTGPTATVEIDVRVPGRSEPEPVVVPLADARVLHAMLGDAIREVGEGGEAAVTEAAPVDRAAVVREAADAITAVIDADKARFPARSNDRAALGGAREIVLGLIGTPPAGAVQAGQVVDRVALIREAIDRLETRARQAPAPGARLHSFRDVAHVLIAELRGMADEAQQCGTPSPDGKFKCALEPHRAGLHADMPLAAIAPNGSRMVWETPVVPTPCSQPNPCEDGELCGVHEEEQAHADGEHEYCGVTCEVSMPSEPMRNFILAKGYPGTEGALNQLLRRAAMRGEAL